MSLGSFLKKAIPVAIAATTGGPVAVYTTVAAQRQQDRARRQAIRERSELAAAQQERERQMSEIYGTGNVSSIQAPLGGSAVTRSGFGSSFGTFLGDVRRNIITPISSVASQVLPFFGSRDQSRQPASTRVPILQGTELQTTGQNEAFVGGFNNVIGQASRFLRTPGGAFATGGGVSAALSMFDSGVPKMRITRKTKRLAQQAYGLAMGDLGTALALFTQLSGLQVDERTFVLILTKRFRNDGAVVTKAALRKTKTTIRRLKNMCDMYDSLRKAPTRRRTTMKRAVGTTLISNK
tara:strand:- start:799 stop:1680 length:882 start_codon:yes stop_codon:yes gene_type:complete